MTGNLAASPRSPTFPGSGSVGFVVLLIFVIATIIAAITGSVPPPSPTRCGIETHGFGFD